MHTTSTKDVALLGFLIKDSIESKVFGACLELEQAVLLILNLHHALVSFAQLMLHHGPHSKSHFDPLSTHTGHHGIAIEGVHLRRDVGPIVLKGLLMTDSSVV